MADNSYSLLPVDCQPDFSDYSLVPVDYNPFRADDVIERARAELASQPQRLAAGGGLPNVGSSVNNAQTAAPISPPGKSVLANQQQPSDMSASSPGE